MTIAYIAIIAIFYGAIFLFMDDASEGIRNWIYPALIIFAILGGVVFSQVDSDDDCARFSYLANDC